MIVPVGKNKHQVNQGGRQNETILDNDIFNKLAAELGALKDPIDSPEVPIDNAQALPENDQPKVDPNVQNAVGQGTLSKNAPQEAPELDWKTVAAQVEDFVQKISNGALEVTDQKRGPNGTWTITFGPIGVIR